MSNVHASTHPLVQHKLSRLRDIKTEPKKFRELVRESRAGATQRELAARHGISVSSVKRLLHRL